MNIKLMIFKYLIGIKISTEGAETLITGYNPNFYQN